MLKRQLALFGATVLLLACLCACGEAKPQDDVTTTTVAATTTTADTTTAQSTTQATEKGETTTQTEATTTTKEETTTTEKETTITEKETTITEKETTTTEKETTTTEKETTTVKVTTTTTTTAKATTTTEKATTTTTTKATTTTTKAEVITALKPLSPKEYYGYTLLAAEADSDVLLYIYDAFVKGAEAMEASFSLATSSYNVTPEQAKKVWSYYTLDYPHHFWVGNGYEVSILDGRVMDIALDYTMNKSERDRAKMEFDAVVNNLLSKVSGSWDEYHRELAVHDALCDLLTYEDVGDKSYDAYGALVGKKAMCEGYAEAFQYLMYQCGIQCLGVNGQANGGTHKWNIVRINDVYYEIDVTWDDPIVSKGTPPLVLHSYFNISDAIMEEDHNIGDDNYPLPHCDSNAENYYKVQGIWVDSFSEDIIANELKTHNVIELYLNKHTPDQFAQWLSEHWGSILKKAGMTHGGYGLAVVGKGVRLTLTK